jgi:hypothetical protein
MILDMPTELYREIANIADSHDPTAVWDCLADIVRDKARKVKNKRAKEYKESGWGRMEAIARGFRLQFPECPTKWIDGSPKPPTGMQCLAVQKEITGITG